MKQTTIPIAQLKRCPIQFRPVKKETLEYYQLRESIQKSGLLVPLLVRPPNEVVDGCHRLEVLSDLGIEEAPCVIRDLTDEEVRLVQFKTHANRVETSPLEYASRLRRIVEVDQSLSLNDVAHLIHKHPDWVRRMLNLVNLAPPLKEAMRKGTLTLSAAHEMAKLPVNLQEEYLPLACSLPHKELIEELRRQARLQKQGKKDARTQDNATRVFEFGPELRNAKEINNEVETPTVAAFVISEEGAKTPAEIWKAALKWAIRQDKISLGLRQQKAERLQRKQQKTIDRLNFERELRRNQ